MQLNLSSECAARLGGWRLPRCHGRHVPKAEIPDMLYEAKQSRSYMSLVLMCTDLLLPMNLSHINMHHKLLTLLFGPRSLKKAEDSNPMVL